jgi:uncharacterized protein (DUF1810 family)
VSDLERFKRAQSDAYSGFSAAVTELQAGRKSGHWIWYIFPQLAGLGSSHTSRVYGLAGAAEAAEYLRDPVLRERLLSAATAVVASTRAGVPLTRLMGSSVDVLKLVSSMTLFRGIARRLAGSENSSEYARVADAAEQILAAAGSEGYPPCSYTLRLLQES